MPTAAVNGAALHYEDSGGAGPPIVFAHGLLMSCRMYDAQVAELRGTHRCIAYDHRGQGGSEVASGGYAMDAVAEDAAALITTLGVAPCHFVGLSMGGFVGMRLAIRRPELLRSLVLLDTSADAETAAKALQFRAMALLARFVGTKPLLTPIERLLFGRTFLADPARAGERRRWRDHLEKVDRLGATRATEGVVGRASVQQDLGRIGVPTTVIVGEEDAVTPPFRAERLVAAIPGARLVRIPQAGHSSPVEEPAAVTAALRAHLAACA